ncbi:MAG: hypothetical protein PWP23_748 [Candidatus Sumerlaeota bacterium]|nr:hypothetical protein [Candidatus Sumerlaeota bacterium]
MTGKVLAIAVNTFKEAVRNRILYVLLFFAILILLGAWVASSLAIFGQEKIIRDLGVATINIISVLIAVFVGVGLVYNDLDKKTIYTIVSKPISRWHFLVGKFLGLLLTIFVNILFMTFFFLLVLYFRDFTKDSVLEKLAVEGISGAGLMFYYIKSAVLATGQALLTVGSLGFYETATTQGIMVSSFLTMLEMTIITAFAVLFSSFSSPTLSAFLTVIVFLIGRANEDLYFFANMLVHRAGGVENLAGGQFLTYWFSLAACHVAPNLEFFNQREVIAALGKPEIGFYPIFYGLAYAASVLAIATVVFNRRNFK